jgi:energy-coupling factor transporter ATP-binding protein EcfA2
MRPIESRLPMPYIGVRPFESEDEPIFFGREAQVSAMLRQLEDDRLMAVVGSSGSGKSSLVRAGLLPAIREGFLLGCTDWLPVIIKPGHEPYRRLALKLAQSARATQGRQPDHSAEDRLLTTLRRSDRGLVEALGEAGLSPEAKVVVVVEFEELFAFRRATAIRHDVAVRDEAAGFVSMLLRTASDSDARVWVVLTMRSDFIGDCEAFLGLPEAVIRRRPKVAEVQAVTGAAVPEIEEVVRLFQDDDRNFLLPQCGDDFSSETYLDISHEALLRQWQRFASEWLVQERSDAEELRRLAQQASLRRQGKGGFIGRDDLHRVLRWKDGVSEAWALRYITKDAWVDVLAYIDESVAKDKQECDREARSKAILRRIVWIVIVIGTIISVIFGVMARRAEERGQRAGKSGREGPKRCRRGPDTLLSADHRCLRPLRAVGRRTRRVVGIGRTGRRERGRKADGDRPMA